MPLATEPIPAMIAAGGKNEDMPAAMPAAIEIGVINSPGGYNGQESEKEGLALMNTEAYLLCGDELRHHCPGPIRQDIVDWTNCIIHISYIIIEIRCGEPKEVGLWVDDTLRVFGIRFAVISMETALIFPVVRPIQH